MTIVPSIKRDYITKLAEEGRRIDGRKFDEYRKIDIETKVVNKAEGSARIKIGNTQVLVGIKMDLGEPFPDTPDCGVLSTAAEFVPLASPDFESGPPRENAIELARVVDRGVRESEVVDIKKLVITPGEKVWIVFIDIHILDYDGNLFDAASLGALAALSTTRIPIIRFMQGGTLEKKDLEAWYNGTSIAEIKELLEDPELDNLIVNKNKGNIKDIPLPMAEPPISCTAIKINDYVMFDPSLDEELIADVRLTVATDNEGDLRAMQKGLSGSFSKDEIQKVIKGALDNGKEIRSKLKAVIS
jgi:exosome complex component RRP42